MNRILIETQYLPSLEFFCAIRNADEIQIECCEHFVKRSYRNHTFIRGANGVEKMVVPLTAKGNRVMMKDVLLDDNQSWRNNHWRTIESAYRKSPYYEHYEGDLQKVIKGQQKHLLQLNKDLLTLCLKWLNWSVKISETGIFAAAPEHTTDMRNVLLSKKPYTERKFYRPVVYTQVFGSVFVENLSVLDLLFCKGPEAAMVLRASALNL